eukprot:PhF_6_TR24754/c0_g1_i3/m.33940
MSFLRFFGLFAVCTMLLFGVGTIEAKIPGGYTEIYRSSVSSGGRVVYLGTYGYDIGGSCEVYVTHNTTSRSLTNAGFFLEPAETPVDAREHQKSNEKDLCNKISDLQGGLNMTLSGSPNSGEYSGKILIKSTPGFYALYFYNCRDNDVELTGHAIQWNRDPPPNGEINYLQVGDWPKPMLYLFFFLVHLAMLFVWIWYLKKSARENRYKIHYYFIALLLLYGLCMLMQMVKYDQFRQTGLTTEVIHGFYGLFLILRGSILVIGIILLGTGWSVLKPHLGDREKKIFAAVIPLQLVVNIAQVILEELSEGSESYVSWQDTLRVLDVICCCIILLPVVWSIKTLKDSSGTDGKVATNLVRLKQFRALYVVLVAYVYYSRIVITVTQDSLHYRYTWVATFLREIGTIFLFLYVGTRFRPCDRNPYLRLDAEDLEVVEVQRELEQMEEAGSSGFDNEPHDGAVGHGRLGQGGTAGAMLEHTRNVGRGNDTE